MFLATKFGAGDWGANVVIRADPEHVHKASNESLLRLGVDLANLCYLIVPRARFLLKHTIAAIVEFIQ